MQTSSKQAPRKLARHRQVHGHPNILWSERANGKKTYAVRYWSSDGRRVIEAVGPRLDQARARQAEVTGRKFKGEVVGSVSTTVGEVVERWREARKVKRSTGDTYDDQIRRRILPRWRNVRVRDVTRADIAAWVGGLRREDGRPGPLGEGTKRLILAVFSEVMAYAVHADVISVNPVSTLDRKHKPRPKERPGRILGDGELENLLGVCSDWLADIVTVTLYQALRLGEAVGLRWKDVDFEAGTLMICRTAYDDGSFGTPKGGKECTIPLTGEARRVLARLWMVAGRPEDGPVFRNGYGGFRRYKDVQRAFVKARRKAGLSESPRPFLFHDLRRSCISRLANAPGAVLPQVQKFARHSKLAQTFAYVVATEDASWAEQADAALAGF